MPQRHGRPRHTPLGLRRSFRQRALRPESGATGSLDFRLDSHSRLQRRRGSKGTLGADCFRRPPLCQAGLGVPGIWLKVRPEGGTDKRATHRWCAGVCSGGHFLIRTSAPEHGQHYSLAASGLPPLSLHRRRCRQWFEPTRRTSGAEGSAIILSSLAVCIARAFSCVGASESQHTPSIHV